MINEANSLIPKKWQEKESPKIQDWITSIEKTYNLETLKYSGEEESEDRKDKWESWREFKQTWRYMEVYCE